MATTARAELMQKNNLVFFNAFIEHKYVSSYPVDEFISRSTGDRQRIKEMLEVYLSQAIGEPYIGEMINRVSTIRCKLLRMAGPITAQNAGFIQGINLAIDHVMGEISDMRGFKAYHIDKVHTYKESFGKFKEEVSRAPFSYEFETAMPPSPPTIIDPYWCGLRGYSK